MSRVTVSMLLIVLAILIGTGCSSTRDHLYPMGYGYALYLPPSIPEEVRIHLLLAKQDERINGNEPEWAFNRALNETWSLKRAGTPEKEYFEKSRAKMITADVLGCEVTPEVFVVEKSRYGNSYRWLVIWCETSWPLVEYLPD